MDQDIIFIPEKNDKSNENVWTLWFGGKPDLDLDTKVNVKYRDGSYDYNILARYFDWNHHINKKELKDYEHEPNYDIVAYQIV